MPKLQIDNQGRVTGMPNISYGTPWPSPNGYPNGFAEPALGMVIHTEVGWEHTVEQEFDDPRYQASAFFSLSFSGAIHQYGPIGKGWAAWTQAAGNRRYRGVENEDGGNPANPLTDPQIESNASLFELLARVDGFPLQPTDDPNGGRGLVFHSSGGAAWGGHDCPGPVRRAQRPRIVARAQQIATEGAPPVSSVVVGPSFSPNISIVMVASLPCQIPGKEGAWIVQPDGSIITAGFAPYLGGANGKPFFAGRTAKGLESRPDGEIGYVIVDTAGERYQFPLPPGP